MHGAVLMLVGINTRNVKSPRTVTLSHSTSVTIHIIKGKWNCSPSQPPVASPTQPAFCSKYNWKPIHASIRIGLSQRNKRFLLSIYSYPRLKMSSVLLDCCLQVISPALCLIVLPHCFIFLIIVSRFQLSPKKYHTSLERVFFSTCLK